MKKVYYSHPFTGRTLREILTVDEEVLPKLKELNIFVIDPMRGHLLDDSYLDLDWKEAHKDPKLYHPLDRDFEDVKEADILFVDLVHSAPGKISIGCAFEVAWAMALGKPIVIWHNNPKSLHVMYKLATNNIFKDLDDCIEAIKKIIG